MNIRITVIKIEFSFLTLRAFILQNIQSNSCLNDNLSHSIVEKVNARKNIHMIHAIIKE
jgi:hypothetical protein